MIDLKQKALAKFLGCAPDDVIELSSKTSEFVVSGREYRVLTDEEATQAAREYILDTVWAFIPEFLASHSVDGVDADAIEAIQANGKCESNNPVLRRLLRDEAHFVVDAIRADGRGHFMSDYDGEEHEEIVTHDGARIALYIYRTN